MTGSLKVFRMGAGPDGMATRRRSFLVRTAPARHRIAAGRQGGARAVSYAVIRRRPAARGGAEADSGTPFVIEESTAHLVSLASRLFTRALQERLGRYGVSVAQWSMLLLLWEEESLTQKELSRRQQIEEPTAARTLQRMERDGLIRREQDRDDNRRRRVVLTETRARALWRAGAGSAGGRRPRNPRALRRREEAPPQPARLRRGAAGLALPCRSRDGAPRRLAKPMHNRVTALRRKFGN